MSRPHRRVRRAIPALGTAGILVVLGAATSPDGRSTGLPARPAASIPRSSAWLSRLPDGEAKRKFILDCTGCHQFDEKIARPAGVPRTEAQWAEAVTRMLATPARRPASRWFRPTGSRPRPPPGSPGISDRVR
ncbi:MAG: hypothetical protein ACREMG_04165 [Gemmatimonadales bacterium]